MSLASIRLLSFIVLRSHYLSATAADPVRAGAQWRTHALAEDSEIQQWDIESYNLWLDQAEKEKSQAAFATKSGLEVEPLHFASVV